MANKKIRIQQNNGTGYDVFYPETVGSIVQMTDYVKPASTSAVAIEDTANSAIGKIEKALDNKINTSDITTTLGTSTVKVPSEKAVTDAMAAVGLGDMLKSVYDTTNNGIVDNAEKVSGFTVGTNVPLNAKFTDTVTPIANNLTETVSGKALDATQGKALSDLVSTHTGASNPHGITKTTVGLSNVVNVKQATTTTYTTTLNTTWSGTEAPYSKVQTVTGILATDNPIVDIVPSGTYATDVQVETDWANIYRIVTSANTVTFYAHAKPTGSIPLQIKAVR